MALWTPLMSLVVTSRPLRFAFMWLVYSGNKFVKNGSKYFRKICYGGPNEMKWNVTSPLPCIIIVYHCYEFNPSPLSFVFPFFLSLPLPTFLFFTFSPSFLYSSLLPYPLKLQDQHFLQSIPHVYASSTREAEDETHLVFKCWVALRKGTIS